MEAKDELKRILIVAIVIVAYIAVAIYIRLHIVYEPVSIDFTIVHHVLDDDGYDSYGHHRFIYTVIVEDESGKVATFYNKKLYNETLAHVGESIAFTYNNTYLNEHFLFSDSYRVHLPWKFDNSEIVVQGIYFADGMVLSGVN